MESWTEIIFVVLNVVATSECARMRSQILYTLTVYAWTSDHGAFLCRVLCETTYGPPVSGNNCHVNVYTREAAHARTYVLLVGGHFRDFIANHENDEIEHPAEITRTVYRAWQLSCRV